MTSAELLAATRESWKGDGSLRPLIAAGTGAIDDEFFTLLQGEIDSAASETALEYLWIKFHAATIALRLDMMPSCLKALANAEHKYGTYGKFLRRVKAQRSILHEQIKVKAKVLSPLLICLDVALAQIEAEQGNLDSAVEILKNLRPLCRETRSVEDEFRVAYMLLHLAIQRADVEDLEHYSASLAEFDQRVGDESFATQDAKHAALRATLIGAAAKAYGEGRPEACATIAARAAKLYPESAQALLWLANASLKLKKYAEAVSSLEEARISRIRR